MYLSHLLDCTYTRTAWIIVCVCVCSEFTIEKKALKTPRLGTGTLCNDKRHSRCLWMLLPAILTMAPVVRGFIIPVGLQQFIYRLSLKELMEVPECSDRK